MSFAFCWSVQADLSRPLPLLVDKNGRFGFVLPAGVNAVYVKTYGTLWRKVTFDGGTTNTVAETSWDGTVADFEDKLHLRYGDVNEDNVISPVTDLAYLEDRLFGQVSMTGTGEQSIFKYDYVCDLNRDNVVTGTNGDRQFFEEWLMPTSVLSGASIP